MANGFTKTKCTHCRGKIEFPSEGRNSFAPCPHCGQNTHLRDALKDALKAILTWAALVGLLVVLPATVAFSEYSRQQKAQREYKENRAALAALEAERDAARAAALAGPSWMEMRQEETKRKRDAFLRSQEQRRIESLLERQVDALEDANRIRKYESFSRDMQAMDQWQDSRNLQRVADDLEEANSRQRMRETYRIGR